ncbi:hypothetical protein DIZ27_32930 [Streptomyces sp. NWU339]|nr:hypothetical protein DIZ27_32930 [Streptomyces sp. NWU339]
MTSLHPPVSEDDPSVATCSGEQVGMCATCQRRTHRYGRGGNPLCSYCRADLQQKWGTSVKPGS